MVAALDPAVVAKIARRAERAWKDFDKGGKAVSHRISHMTKDELKYRLHHEPGERSRAGKKIRVVREKGQILVAPRHPKLDLQKKADLKELKDREGLVRAYRLIAKDGGGPQKNAYDSKIKVGDKLTNSFAVGTFEWCKEHFRHKNYPNGERIVAIEFESEDITDREPTLRVKAGTVVEELDLIALGIKPKPTTGLMDLLTANDKEKLQDHTGTVRAYRLAANDGGHPKGNAADPKIQVGDKPKGLVVGTLEWCKAHLRDAGYTYARRIFAVEVAADDLTTNSSEQLSAKSAEVKEDLDLVAMGLRKKPKPGVLDCLEDQDVRDLVEDHRGTIRAYKHVTKDGKSPHQANKLVYKLGDTLSEPNADTDKAKDCSNGLNVASLAWVQRDRAKSTDARIFAVEFDASDVACVPTKTDGKFRTKKLTVVAEIDPQTEKEIAAIPPPTPPAAPKPAPAVPTIPTKKDDPSIVKDLYAREPGGKKKHEKDEPKESFLGKIKKKLSKKKDKDKGKG